MAQRWAGATSGERSRGRTPRAAEASAVASRSPSAPPPPAPAALGREEGRGRGGVWAFGGGDVEDVTPRPGRCQTSGCGARGAAGSRALQRGQAALPARRPRRHPALNPSPRAPEPPSPRRTAHADSRGGERPSGSRLGARGRGRALPGGRLGGRGRGRGRGRAPGRVGGRGRGRGRGAAAPRATPGARGPRQSPGGAMAAGSITTLPALPEDGGSGAFPPGHFKDPKRLYCKNGGFFLRIHPDGRVDGVREKSDPHIKLQLQAEERGVVSIKGVCANRYLAMKEDGRLLASKCVTDECFFFERLESNNYNTYRSRKYSSWYVALKRTGQYKLGPKTGPGQKAILFLPMSAKS
ncbi:LOW QUALITY PROTEIN: fibroblast growth factor 2 [Mirounga leonina]|uniref:LOW QUALITY PROTEIN: fibroblast growth factor 2 n=1 Tax=Mirounga leonina TaxID=9715 RepID=UPI00156BE807|nr:LOW QUALITY PROTEIN: fibroblast growth factor 2 [Mirounga leonina]